jgi:hypothetical protein
LISSSTDIDSSDYSLKQYSIEPDLTFTRGSNFRMQFGYKFGNKTNDPNYGGYITSNSSSIITNVKYNILQSTSLMLDFTYNNITFNAASASAANSPVGYVVLDGLLPGKNFLWNLDLTKKLGGNLELNIRYEGRKPGEGRTVHTGRVSLRAML